MKKQRLLELAGIPSNMNNPSQEPYTEIPASSEEPPAYGTPGEDEESELLLKIKEHAKLGLESTTLEEAHEHLRHVLHFLGDEDEGKSPEEQISSH